METTKLVPTEQTEKSKYYELKEGNVTIEIVKELIPDELYKDYEFEFDNGSISVNTKGIHRNRIHIGVNTIYAIKILNDVCLTFSSRNFSVTIYNEIKYIHTILF
jgi:hypothetical protein